jgi:hypothetical protein
MKWEMKGKEGWRSEYKPHRFDTFVSLIVFTFPRGEELSCPFSLWGLRIPTPRAREMYEIFGFALEKLRFSHLVLLLVENP